MNFGFGVDVGGTTVKIAYFNQEGSLLDKWEIPTDTKNGGTQILPDIAASISDYLEKKNIPRSQVIGIGIGVPGPVDDDGNVNCCSNLGWGVFNVHEALKALTGLPVKAGNDANVAALGEAWKGGGHGCENMLLATFGTGVGGGIIIGGQPINGAHGAAGEIGHVMVNRHEQEPCTCGNYGCAEQYCSATGVVRLAKMKLSASDRDSLMRTCQHLTCKDVFDAGAKGDALALEVLEQVYDYMGQFLAAVCCTLDPELVVLGGGVSNAGQPFLEGVKRYFDKYIFHASRSIGFALAVLGNSAGTYGAFKLILDAQRKSFQE
ncbi:MAG: ROK family glucokinase [Ruminococcaceae bacterium]|nr:ROK family glucokinase [Oscillospiraceae bacterium]